MNRNRIILLTSLIAIATIGYFVFRKSMIKADDRFVSYLVDTKTQDIKFYWKNEEQVNFKSLQNLKTWLDMKQKKLLFAMNAGMYKQDNSP